MLSKHSFALLVKTLAKNPLFSEVDSCASPIKILSVHLEFESATARPNILAIVSNVGIYGCRIITQTLP